MQAALIACAGGNATVAPVNIRNALGQVDTLSCDKNSCIAGHLVWQSELEGLAWFLVYGFNQSLTYRWMLQARIRVLLHLTDMQESSA